MKAKLIACSALVLSMSGVSVFAQESLESEESMESGKSVETPSEPVIFSDYQPPGAEAQIVIRPGGRDKVFYEFWVKGELVEIKVVPDVGPEYYLVPADGGGWIRSPETDLLVPSWVLFRW